jgi:hypothetical protein
MSRWRKGTLDHDSDGRMGGSLKETEMTKKTTTKPEPIATNAGPTVTATDPDTGETEVVEPGKGKKATAAEGGAARMATMEPDTVRTADGQVAATSGAKKG